MPKEFYFDWACPGCKHIQGDSVNFAQGPYLSLTCGGCGNAFEARSLTTEDAQAWDDALYAAEVDSLGIDFVNFINAKDYTVGDVLADDNLLEKLRQQFEER